MAREHPANRRNQRDCPAPPPWGGYLLASRPSNLRRQFPLHSRGCCVWPPLGPGGRAELKLKTPWRDGTTHPVKTPLEFMLSFAAQTSRGWQSQVGPTESLDWRLPS